MQRSLPRWREVSDSPIETEKERRWERRWELRSHREREREKRKGEDFFFVRVVLVCVLRMEWGREREEGLGVYRVRVREGLLSQSFLSLYQFFWSSMIAICSPSLSPLPFLTLSPFYFFIYIWNMDIWCTIMHRPELPSNWF